MILLLPSVIGLGPIHSSERLAPNCLLRTCHPVPSNGERVKMSGLVNWLNYPFWRFCFRQDLCQTG